MWGNHSAHCTGWFRGPNETNKVRCMKCLAPRLAMSKGPRNGDVLVTVSLLSSF